MESPPICPAHSKPGAWAARKEEILIVMRSKIVLIVFMMD
jgi:hypothetical protein